MLDCVRLWPTGADRGRLGSTGDDIAELPHPKPWTYEIRRKLVTGDDKDVQFDDLNRTYKFGIAVFDNAQIEHSWSPALLRLVFKK